MQQTIQTLVEKNAKALKVSRAKLQQLAEDVAKVAQKDQTNRNRAVVGIVHKTSSEKIRKEILSQNAVFTSRDIAERLGVNVISVNNNLFSLQRRGVVVPTGETKRYGGRGKPATIWKLA